MSNYCEPDEVNWNKMEFTKEMLDYLRAVYCNHPMVIDLLDEIDRLRKEREETDPKIQG